MVKVRNNEARLKERINNSRSPYKVNFKNIPIKNANTNANTNAKRNSKIVPKRVDEKDSWDHLNRYQPIVEAKNVDFKKEWVSATSIKNYLMHDPLLDWLDLYFVDYGFNDKLIDRTQPLFLMEKQQQTRRFEVEKNKYNVLFEMGNKFEEQVINSLSSRFPGCLKKVITDSKMPICPKSAEITNNYMKEGIPIIVQAPLYNEKNRTFGVADIIIRSDWINRIIINPVLSQEEINIKAPKLSGNYHYRVIDIKWTTMPLCSDGKLIRNSQRFPAYKGQLAIYNAAIGVLQGYTPDISYILSKSCSINNFEQENNCFSLLGQIDYSGFDKKYLSLTNCAIYWIRNVRYNGNRWQCLPKPSHKELYPNMCNTYDSPYHEVKKELADKINELTEIWMVGYKNRCVGHENDIYQWSDPRCSVGNLGINGKKIGPIIEQIIKINQDQHHKIMPDIISNNIYDWQNKKELDFFIDFETINCCFYDKVINLENSSQETGVIFMIGIGYEEEGTWRYQNIKMDNFDIENEGIVIEKFINYIEDKVNLYMIKNNLNNRNLCNPTFFHWGNAEKSMFKNTDFRHNNKWEKWVDKNNWIDMCKIFQSEPIVIKGAKKFGLKEIAKVMKQHNFISTGWRENTIDNGLRAMIDAIEYYKFMYEYSKKSINEQRSQVLSFQSQKQSFQNIMEYNEIDCKVLWEIICYLRNNHTEK